MECALTWADRRLGLSQGFLNWFRTQVLWWMLLHNIWRWAWNTGKWKCFTWTPGTSWWAASWARRWWRRRRCSWRRRRRRTCRSLWWASPACVGPCRPSSGPPSGTTSTVNQNQIRAQILAGIKRSCSFSVVPQASQDLALVHDVDYN